MNVTMTHTMINDQITRQQ